MTVYLSDDVGLIALSDRAKAKFEAGYDQKPLTERLAYARQHTDARAALSPGGKAPPPVPAAKPMTEEKYAKLPLGERLAYARSKQGK